MNMQQKGAFKRAVSGFRNFIKKGGEFPPEAGRYHLYVSYACPWASRCLAVRALKGLEKVISISVTHPTPIRTKPDDPEDEHFGWWFCDGTTQENIPNPLGNGSVPAEGATVDHVHGRKTVRDIYQSHSDATAYFSVPILFDKKTDTIVNNESSEIIEMLGKEFDDFCEDPDTSVDLFPANVDAARVQEINDKVYVINNGVYRCGFCTTQEAYDEAVTTLYEHLDWAEEQLDKSRYLLGDKLSASDLRLYVTLVRFDAVYVQHFKCTRKMIREYPNLLNFTRELYQHPRIRSTTNMDHIKRHYFTAHVKINMFGIIPQTTTDLDVPHNRAAKTYTK